VAERQPVVIEAALNGGREPTENPAIPLTPSDVSAEAKRCFDAGATVAHIHARTIEGAWSFDPAWYADANRRIRAEAPGMLVSITSVRLSGFSVDLVIDMIGSLAEDPVTRPDLISINLGHIAVWEPETGRTLHFPNDYEDVTRLLDACTRTGIVPELGVLDFGFINNAVALKREGLLPERPWFLLELDSPGYGVGGQLVPATPDNYDALSDALAEQFPDSLWAAHGNGTATYPILELALESGAHIRIGFEDTVTLPDGTAPNSNADEVNLVREIARAKGRRPATPNEARRIIGIPEASSLH
jgi:3-keto-5-aminohexanoate cleavage enzyme